LLELQKVYFEDFLNYISRNVTEPDRGHYCKVVEFIIKRMFLFPSFFISYPSVTGRLLDDNEVKEQIHCFHALYWEYETFFYSMLTMWRLTPTSNHKSNFLSLHPTLNSILLIFLTGLTNIVGKTKHNTTLIDLQEAILGDIQEAFAPPPFNEEHEVTKWLQAYNRY
jgi:hypothetical protein